MLNDKKLLKYVEFLGFHQLTKSKVAENVIKSPQPWVARAMVRYLALESYQQVA